MDVAAADLPLLPRRSADGHKYSFGTVIVIGGAITMIGAPCFVGWGAFRCGSGVVRLVVPSEILTTCLGILPAAIGARAETCDLAREPLGNHTSIAIGSGMAGTALDAALLSDALKTNAPLVIDGGALAMACATPIPVRSAGTILTPHLGEYALLAKWLSLPALSADSSGPQRREAASALATATNSVVVLKGKGTVVSNGASSWTCSAGNPCLAIAGSGDVLSGVIAGLVAQGLSPYDSACLGVQLHARAGELWAEKLPFGMSPIELAALIPQAAHCHALNYAAQEGR